MSIESFVARILRFLSIPLFLVALFLTYQNLPDRVAVHYTPSGQADGYLGRDSVFYIAGSIMLIFNILFGFLSRSILTLPDAAVGVFGTFRWRNNPEALRLSLIAWLGLGAAALHVFLVFCLNALSELNDSQSAETVFDYRWLLQLGLALLLVWFLYLPLRLFLTKPRVVEES
ncbi:MAG: DUF1648 domain-containing protein [Cytophagaceae bacterium]|nr:DUF1648 domain-containing protein [Cytophagaceae bacterium]